MYILDLRNGLQASKILPIKEFDQINEKRKEYIIKYKRTWLKPYELQSIDELMNGVGMFSFIGKFYSSDHAKIIKAQYSIQVAQNRMDRYTDTSLLHYQELKKSQDKTKKFLDKMALRLPEYFL